jgi:hypothetical protein
VTAEQVSDVARRYTAPDDLHVVVVGDRSHLEPGTLGLGPVVERSLSED